MGVVYGPTGSGKSWYSLKLAKAVDPDFSIDNVVFTVDEFFTLLNSDKLKKGSVVVFDEAGVAIPNREWYSIHNRMVNYVFQVFRFKNIGVIFTVPSLDFIDSQTRKLMHNVVEISRRTGRVYAFAYDINWNPRFRQTYHQRLKDASGGVVRGTSVSKPDVRLSNAYERKVNVYKQSVLDDSPRRIQEKLAKKKASDAFDVNKVADSIAAQPDYFRGKTGVLVLERIMNKFNVGKYKAARVQALANDILAALPVSTPAK